MDVGSLLSPPEAKRPEPFMSSASRQNLNSLASLHSDHQLPPISKIQPSNHQNRLPLSPPESPYTNLPKNNTSYSPRSNPQQDPELFPDIGEVNSVASDPLFPPEQASIEAAIDKHIGAQKQVEARYRPTKEEYLTVALMVSSVVKQMKANPWAWYRREREYLDRQAAARPSRIQKKQIHREYQKIAPKNTKGGAGPKKPKQKQPELAPKTSRAPRAPRQTPNIQALQSYGPMSPPQPKAPRQPSTRDDVDFASVTDMTPSPSTLGDNSKALKIDWKGHPRDLSRDPDRHLLHEAEIQLAGTLRLSCAQYLTAKRKIFLARVHCEKIGKEFRKTDAQQACKIDVNKASKLWTAFEKVGWLHRSHIESFL